MGSSCEGIASLAEEDIVDQALARAQSGAEGLVIGDADPTGSLPIDLAALEVGTADILAITARTASLVLGLEIGLHRVHTHQKFAENWTQKSLAQSMPLLRICTCMC